MTTTMSVEERIASFPHWHYEFELQGHRTTVSPAERNRHAQRARYFFDPLLALCGGTLEGKRVLDLGCNAGYWSLLATRAGADYVLGIDGRDMHIQQARLVFEANRIARDRYDFRTANLFAVDEHLGGFDVVLNLGLMYHVAKHMQLMEFIAAHASDLLVTDTAIEPGRGSFMRLHRENVERPRSAVDRELVMMPSRKAVIDLTKEFGFQTVVLAPRFVSWDGCDDFRLGRRRAFMSSRRTPLVGLDVERSTPASEAFGAARRSILGQRVERLVAS